MSSELFIWKLLTLYWHSNNRVKSSVAAAASKLARQDYSLTSYQPKMKVSHSRMRKRFSNFVIMLMWAKCRRIERISIVDEVVYLFQWNLHYGFVSIVNKVIFHSLRTPSSTDMSHGLLLFVDCWGLILASRVGAGQWLTHRKLRRWIGKMNTSPILGGEHCCRYI